MKFKLMEKTKNIIKIMTEEWITNAKNGVNITSEFTSSPDKIPNLFKEMFLISNELEEAGGYWTVSICGTCHAQHGGESYLHVQIVQIP